MFKKIFNIFSIFLAIFSLFSAKMVMAETKLQDTFNGSLESSGSQMGYKPESDRTFYEWIGLVISVALSFIGVIFLVLTIYGGFLWMTAQGDKAKVDKAKDLLTQAIIGLVIVISAYAITSFVGNSSFVENSI